MAIKGSATITLTQYRDTQSVTRYYKLQPAGSSAPLKPETKPPSSDWTDSEPACDISKELYFCDLTIFSNGEWEYSAVSKSSSYEAAKQAYNKAQSAKDGIDNLEIGGRNLILKSETKPISKYIDEITTQTGIAVSEWSTNNAIRSYGVCNSNKIFGTLATGSSSPTSAAGQAYVHSIYVKNNGETPIIISNNGIGGSRTIQPGESTRVILHGTGDNARYLQFVFFSSNLGDALDVTYWHPKIEIGDKATDWTPAPEDVDAGIANAQETADSIASNIYAPGSTLLDGSKINDGSLSINQMDDTVAGTYSDPTTKRGTMEWKDDALHIKSVDSNAQNTYETVIGGDGIKFNWNGTETASIDQDELRINKTVVINAMEVGNWSWAIHPTTGNLMVKWNGGK